MIKTSRRKNDRKKVRRLVETPLGLKLKPILYAMHDGGEEVERRRRKSK